MKILRLTGLAAGLCLALGGAASAQDITIGVAGPLTGQYASFGQQFKNGAELAVADINAAGGVLGKKIKMVMEDDACDPKQAHAVAEKLVGHESAVRRRPLLLGLVDPGLRRLCRSRRPADHARLDQSEVHRARHVEHVPRLRP